MVKSLPQPVARAVPSGFNGGGSATDEGSDAQQGFANAWKGWTNSEGERASTSAQFSRFGEHSALTFASSPGLTAASARVHAPQAPALATPTFAPHEAAALAPIHAALERFVSRSQEQLAVTVRFEQGGSLSLKLSLGQGGIQAQIHTDVPGLEGALRSAWDSFAQDWQHRGVKLAAPSFGSTTTGDHGGGREGRSPQGGGADGDATPFGTTAGGRPLFAAGRRAGVSLQPGPVDPARAARISVTPRGFRTWA